jgi:putative oxidoreductase
MRRLLYCSSLGASGSLGLLVLRLVMGAAFMIHGWPKIQNPTGWMPAETGFPPALQALAAVAEFVGGIGLILGFLTPLAALGIAATMGVAITKVHLPAGHPFVDSQGGHSYELAAVYLAGALAILLSGPGRFSLDACLFGRRASTGAT